MECILAFNDTKISKTYCVLAKKWKIFQRVLKMADFGQSAEGGPFAKISKSADFLVQRQKVQKIGNACRTLT